MAEACPGVADTAGDLSRSLKLFLLVLFHLSIHQLVQVPLLIAHICNLLQRLVLGSMELAYPEMPDQGGSKLQKPLLLASS